MTEFDSEGFAIRLAELADSKLAIDVAVLDMRELVSYTDFLVVCSARNERQSAAITDEVRISIKREDGTLPAGVEGKGDMGWLVMDYLDCVLHVFTPEARERFALEDLWHEAPRLDLTLDANADSRQAASG